MSMLPVHADSFDRASIRRLATRTRRVPTLLESLGRGLVHAALERVMHGGITLIDEQRQTRAHAGSEVSATVHVHDASFYSAVAFGGSVGVAESYMDGAWSCDNLALLIETITMNIPAMRTLEGPIARVLSPLSSAAYRLDRNTRAGSRRNIVAHYDLGNDFFRLFLDPTMTYSCAIFENGATSLEAAQVEKIDRACRKLRLRRTDHLLEIGTGWGALAIHAASRYGCKVTTTTISDEQHRLATARVHDAGLSDRVEVIKTDYRDIRGIYDKIVSIEMLEAVGAEHLGTYFSACSRLLNDNGAALIQSIVIRDQYFHAAARRRDFLKKYIFPGSCLPSVGAILDAVRDRSDLRLWHMEDIGPHYATTLHLWREAFHERLHEVRAMGYDERFIRMWDYYLCYCEGAFRARHVGDVQLLFTKPMCRFSPGGSKDTHE